MRKLFILLFLFYGCSTTAALRWFGGEKEKQVTISIVGDIMIHSLQLTTAYKNTCDCYEFDPVFKNINTFLWMSDITIGNLETTLPGDKKLFAGYPQFGAPNELADTLKNSGFDILTTSNNHCVDTGRTGMDNTIKVLDTKGFHHLGTYISPEEYEKNRLLKIEKNGLKLIFLSYTYGTNGIAVPKGKVVNIIDKQLIADDIALAKKQNPDFVIVYFHFGTEYARLPDKFQQDIVNHTFQEGADIILGGHPHVLQPYEVGLVKDKYGVEKERLVIYSLGNFVSGQFKRYTNGGIIFNFTLAKKEKSGKPEYLIKDVSYLPVFVYVSNDKNGSQYNVLPVEKYLSNDREPKLTPQAYQLMVEFYNDTVEHFNRYSKWDRRR